MSSDRSDLAQINNPDRERAERAWSSMNRLQCAGILHIALRYGERQTATNAFIESTAALPWAALGVPLQEDVTFTLLQLERLFR